jgi:beta-barrel assembly-enhancing protease
MNFRAIIFAICIAIIAFTSSVTAQNSVNNALPSAIDYTPQNDDERSLWLAMDEEEREVKNSKFLIKDPALNDYIRSVLCKAVGQDRCKSTRIYLMRTPEFNASMAPNGMMVVWSGLLLRARNEAELATVLGHEFGHFENQHSLQGFRDLRAKTDAIKWLSYVPYVGIVGQIGLVGSIFNFNREMERQADLAALEYLTGSGYDPMAASAIWEQLREEMDATAADRGMKSQKDDNGGFFATHPNSGERMEYLREAALKKTGAGKRNNKAEYRAALAPYWPLLIEDQIKLNDFGATEFLLKRLGKEGWSAEMLYARGELYRARGKTADFAKAVEFYQQALAKGDAPVETWRGLGLSLIRSGQLVPGQKALRSYLEKQPASADRAMITMMAGGM